MGGSPAFEMVYAIVCRIPRGKVLTYGLVSHMLGKRLSAQGVGWALNALPPQSAKDKKYSSATVPWHRVINSKGGMSTHKIPEIPPDMQKELLMAEGVVFGDDDTLVLDDYLWHEGMSQAAGLNQTADINQASGQGAADRARTTSKKSAKG